MIFPRSCFSMRRGCGHCLVQGEMGSCRVVVSEVGAQEPFEMAVIVNDNVIETLAPDRADQPLDVGILPG